MIAATTATQTDAPLQTVNPESWERTAVHFAAQIAGDGFPRGDLAQLRRMNPDAPDAAAYWRLMADRDLFGSPDVEKKWALILRGIAVMTPTSPTSGYPSAHNRNAPVGRALFLGGDAQRKDSGYYSETRLNRLLNARGPMLRALLVRMFKMMASANQPFDWYEMATFILSDGYDDERAENARRRIATEYYRAQRQAQSRSSE